MNVRISARHLFAFAMTLCVIGSAAPAARLVPLNQMEGAARDVFGPDLRRDATIPEMRWTVNVRGCSGSMLSPKHVLTANHCSPAVGAKYTSGGCYALGNCKDDLVVTKKTECNSSLDYCIVEVRGTNNAALEAQRYPTSVITDMTEIKTGKDGDATPLFTVGFPADMTGRPVFSPGFAKRIESTTVMYNCGSINGNSGGAVFRNEDYALVTMTNFGTHAFGQPGWDNNDPENSSAWNGGGRMDKIYAQSATLKSLYPNGKNPLVDREGALLNPPTK